MFLMRTFLKTIITPNTIDKTEKQAAIMKNLFLVLPIGLLFVLPANLSAEAIAPQESIPDGIRKTGEMD